MQFIQLRFNQNKIEFFYDKMKKMEKNEKLKVNAVYQGYQK